ncbi:DUF4430 domain-containing protein [Metasolibacillus sp. FSL H7-0170]|uniref:DUF4430 domain-containing protein n=1 Tax=Metasolibacillus sp. FSL H7-0170 TaxID=2921431 RepID=UPI0031594C36
MVQFKKWWHLAFALLLAVSLVSPAASAAVLQPVNEVQRATVSNVSLSVDGLYGTPIVTSTTQDVTASTTALSFLEQVLTAQNKSYVVTVHPTFGPYLESIEGLAAGSLGGWDGWVYTVNGNSPTVGLDAYVLSANDVVRVYYTTWAQLKTTNTVAVDDVNPSVTVNLTGDLFNTVAASNLANWTINTGTTALTAQSITVNTNQQAVITFAGQANAGTIIITASASALLGGLASDPLEIEVQ